jgi:hypothetical protein
MEAGHVGFCDGQKWRWGRFSPRTSVSPVNVHSICFSTIIFTITRGWHIRPGVAAVPIASQSRIKKNLMLLWRLLIFELQFCTSKTLLCSMSPPQVTIAPFARCASDFNVFFAGKLIYFDLKLFFLIIFYDGFYFAIKN